MIWQLGQVHLPVIKTIEKVVQIMGVHMQHNWIEKWPFILFFRCFVIAHRHNKVIICMNMYPSISLPMIA